MGLCTHLEASAGADPEPATTDGCVGCLTEGRAYSAAEYRAWVAAANLIPGEIVPTLVHCGVLPAVNDRSKDVEHAATTHAVAQQIDLLAEHSKVVHESILWNARQERAKTAVGISGELDDHLPRHGVDRPDHDLGVERRPGKRDAA